MKVSNAVLVASPCAKKSSKKVSKSAIEPDLTNCSKLFPSSSVSFCNFLAASNEACSSGPLIAPTIAPAPAPIAAPIAAPIGPQDRDWETV